MALLFKSRCLSIVLCILLQVYLSTRSGAWIWSRIEENGVPLGMGNGRFRLLFRKTFPKYSTKAFLKKLNNKFDQKKYSIQPKVLPFCQHPTVNDDLPNRLATGTVQIAPNIAEFTATGVRFDNGTVADDVDVVIMATGYTFGFPFIDKTVIDAVDNQVNLYKHMFPPQLGHNTLAVIGCIQPIGAINPICEMQCRLATRVFKVTVF